MQARIDAHRRERGDQFTTVEEPLALASALERLDDCDVVLVDCLTLWLSNLLESGATTAQIMQHVESLLTVINQRRFHTILVTNEVGMGIVPMSGLARQFRDLAGLTHQKISRHADEVYLAILGTILRLRPHPVITVPSTGEE